MILESPHSSQESMGCCKIIIAGFEDIEPSRDLGSRSRQDSRTLRELTAKVLSAIQDSDNTEPLSSMLDELCERRLRFKNLSVFVAVSNDAYLQVLGEPVYSSFRDSSMSTLRHGNPQPNRCTIRPPTTTATDNRRVEERAVDMSNTVNTGSTTLAGPNPTFSNTRAIIVSSIKDSSSFASSSQSNRLVSPPSSSRRGSSLELFSSGSTTTANDSVILFSGESVSHDKQPAEQQTEPREISLSAFLYNHTRKLDKSTPIVHMQGSTISANATTPSNTSSSLFSSLDNSSDRYLVGMDTNASLPSQEYMEASQSTKCSTNTNDSWEDLSGNLSDECEDLLSNRAYRLRKRKRKHNEADGQCINTKPQQKVAKSSKQHGERVIKRKKRKLKRKKRFENTLKAERNYITRILCTSFLRTPLVQNLYGFSFATEEQDTILKEFKRALFNQLYKVPYHRLLLHHCPIPAELEWVQRTSISNYDVRDCGSPSELSKLVKVHLSHDQVFSFLRSVLIKLVPVQLFGSVHNRNVFLTHVRRFIQLRRFETLSVQQMCRGIKLSQCEWLKLSPRKHRGRPHPPVPHLFERLIRWLVEEVIVPTLRVFFYVTEHSEHNNRLFYYRKEVWSRIEQEAIGTVIPYKKISVEEVQKHFHFGETLGISKIRFLPKSNGVRAIVNFGSMVKPSDQPKQLHTVNDQLKDVFHVLSYEKTTRPQLVGSSCFGLNEVFTKLKKFSAKQKSINSATEGPLLFVRVDISSCYDSMLASKLFSIISQSTISMSSYVIRRYAKIFLSNGKIRRTFLKAAAPKKKCPSFFNFAKNEAKTSSNCIFVDQDHHVEITRDRVERLLHHHLHGNIVKLGKDYYKQVQGIAHGAQLSTLLCGFYYADMERTCLPKIDPNKGLLMRYVDDFLLITREVGVARQFLDTMQRGVAEYNCKINPAKTVTNFRVREDGGVEYFEDVEWISWCGVLLNTKTLDVRTDFSRYTEKNIRDKMTISLHGKHFSYLRSFSRRAIRLRCLPIFLDARVVSDKNLLINMYQGFLIASYKYLTVLLSMPNANKMAYPNQRGGFTRRELLFFFRTAVGMFTYFWQLTKNKNIRNPLLGKDMCVWLGCHSLREVLSQHQPHKFVFLIRLLSSKLYTLSNILGVDMVRRFFSATKWQRSKNIFTVTV